MANANNQRWANKPAASWRLKKDNLRQLPCHANVRVRVKVLEPGVQSRWCDRCDCYRYFDLQPMPKLEGVLALRWLTTVEGKAHEALADQINL